MKVKDAMHKGAAFVSPNTNIRDCAKQMKALDVGALPVKTDSGLVGIITDRDIAVRGVAEGLDPTKVTAKELMSVGTHTCSANDDLDNAILLMKSKKIRRLPVADDNGTLIGMLSLGDISAAASDKVAHTILKAVATHH